MVVGLRGTGFVEGLTLPSARNSWEDLHQASDPGCGANFLHTRVTKVVPVKTRSSPRGNWGFLESWLVFKTKFDKVKLIKLCSVIAE